MLFPQKRASEASNIIKMVMPQLNEAICIDEKQKNKIKCKELTEKPNNFANLLQKLSQENQEVAKSTRSYLGFGWLMSFIPYTYAYEARKKLLQTSAEAMEEVIKSTFPTNRLLLIPPSRISSRQEFFLATIIIVASIVTILPLIATLHVFAGDLSALEVIGSPIANFIGTFAANWFTASSIITAISGTIALTATAKLYNLSFTFNQYGENAKVIGLNKIQLPRTFWVNLNDLFIYRLYTGKYVEIDASSEKNNLDYLEQFLAYAINPFAWIHDFTVIVASILMKIPELGAEFEYDENKKLKSLPLWRQILKGIIAAMVAPVLIPVNFFGALWVQAYNIVKLLTIGMAVKSWQNLKQTFIDTNHWFAGASDLQDAKTELTNINNNLPESIQIESLTDIEKSLETANSKGAYYFSGFTYEAFNGIKKNGCQFDIKGHENTYGKSTKWKTFEKAWN